MNKISVTIDVSKINKDKITERKFTNKDGEEITVKEYKIDVIQLREPKHIKELADTNMVKTHFVVEAQTKQEREAKAESVFLGDGIQFLPKDSDSHSQENTSDLEW